MVSQSVAATLHVGQKLGFGRGVPSLVKSIQHLNDLQDLTVESTAAIASLGKHGDAQPLVQFVASGRLRAWLTTLEHSIQAPFYYGERKSYVDFYFLQTLDWIRTAAFDPLQPVTGDVFADFPRVASLHATLRALPSYATTRATGPIVSSVLNQSSVARYRVAASGA